MATAGTKRKKKYIMKKSKKIKGRLVPELSVGMQGILITTNDKEKLCVSEAYNLFNEYADILYGPEGTDNVSENEVDLGEQLLQEIKTSIADNKKRFQATFTGVKNVVFIQVQPPVDPCHLVHHILTDIKTKQTPKTRFCLRMIPVKAVCYASLSEIKTCAFKVLAPYFHTDLTSSIPFSVHYKSRINETLKRDSVIELLASIVTGNEGYHHCVNLKHPKLVVAIEIVKNLCCLSVLEDFFELKQYNIKSISDIFIKATCSSEETNLTEVSNELKETCQTDSINKTQDTPNVDSETKLPADTNKPD